MSFLRFGRCCVLLNRQCVSPKLLRPIHFSSFLDQIVQFKLRHWEGIAEVQVKDWHVKVGGDKVSEFDEYAWFKAIKPQSLSLLDMKALLENCTMRLTKLPRLVIPLIDIETNQKEDETENTSSSSIPEPSEKEHTGQPAAATSSSHSTNNEKLLAAPAVRKMIRESNLDASKIEGTGKDGRLLKEDGIFISRGKQSGDRIVPIRGYSRAMIKSMTESLKIPHFGFDDEYSMDKLIETRDVLNAVGKEHGIKFSYMPLIIKATSLALLQFPIVNSSVDDKMENLIYKSAHNISLAMDTPGGLVVPNVKNCNLNLANAEKLSKEDLTDGTFSISNVGAIGGGTYVSPVIFAPQVAIAALGRVQKLPRFNDEGNVVAKKIVNISFAADHRVVDELLWPGSAICSSNTSRIRLRCWAICAEFLKKRTKKTSV
uniref:Peripheral subunit-binding (PSBD) domain-containing protein n=1 Tax=Ditylenchus dipsaci TaxID=166011 RepID=A0A915DY00_9BILA